MRQFFPKCNEAAHGRSKIPRRNVKVERKDVTYFDFTCPVQGSRTTGRLL